jgi:ribose transport system permease protein
MTLHISRKFGVRPDRGPEGQPGPVAGIVSRSLVLDILERGGLFLIVIAEIAFFSAEEPTTFATMANFRTTAVSMSVLMVAAMALLFPLVGGRFDVSIGANLSTCAVACAAAMSSFGLPLGAAIIIAICVGAIVGIVNGFVVAFLGVNSFIATIGTSTILGGLLQAYTRGLPIQSDLSPALTNLGNAQLLGIPRLLLLAILACIVCWYGLTQTPYGRHLWATGTNINAARLNGLRPGMVVLTSFVVSGAFAGVAGILQVAAEGSGDPNIGTITFILPAFAAVFLGATTIQPGRYNVPGTVLGLIFTSTTISGLELVGLSPWVTDVVNGGVVVVAIAISAQVKRGRTGVMEIGS